jgi:hypothetical protein
VLALGARQLAVIQNSTVAGVLQDLVHLLGRLDGGAIHDAHALARAHQFERAGKALGLVSDLDDLVVQIGTIDPGIDHMQMRAPQLPGNVVDHVVGSRGRERQ